MFIPSELRTVLFTISIVIVLMINAFQSKAQTVDAASIAKQQIDWCIQNLGITDDVQKEKIVIIHETYAEKLGDVLATTKFPLSKETRNAIESMNEQKESQMKATLSKEQEKLFKKQLEDYQSLAKPDRFK